MHGKFVARFASFHLRRACVYCNAGETVPVNDMLVRLPIIGIRLLQHFSCIHITAQVDGSDEKVLDNQLPKRNVGPVSVHAVIRRMLLHAREDTVGTKQPTVDEQM